MEQTGVFRRSAAGQQALDSRDKRLGARLRALLLMAEGKPIAQFGDIARALGAPDDALAQLRDMGFVDSTGAAGATPAAAQVRVPVDASPAASAAPPVEAAAPVHAPVPDGQVYDQFRTASGLIRELASDTMGLKAFFFILKVDKCGTLAELEALLPDLMPVLKRQRGDQEAARIESRLRGLLSGGATGG